MMTGMVFIITAFALMIGAVRYYYLSEYVVDRVISFVFALESIVFLFCGIYLLYVNIPKLILAI